MKKRKNSSKSVITWKFKSDIVDICLQPANVWNWISNNFTRQSSRATGYIPHKLWATNNFWFHPDCRKRKKKFKYKEFFLVIFDFFLRHGVFKIKKPTNKKKQPPPKNKGRIKERKGRDK